MEDFTHTFGDLSSTGNEADEWVETHAGRPAGGHETQTVGEIDDIPDDVDGGVSHAMGGLSVGGGGKGGGRGGRAGLELDGSGKGGEEGVEGEEEEGWDEPEEEAQRDESEDVDAPRRMGKD